MLDMVGTIALIGGLYLLATGAGFLLQPTYYRKMIIGQGRADPILLNLSGACHFLVGLVVLVNVASFATLASTAVMLLGGGAFLKGVFLIVLPTRAAQAPKLTDKGLRIAGLGFASAGVAYLCLLFL